MSNICIEIYLINQIIDQSKLDLGVLNEGRYSKSTPERKTKIRTLEAIIEDYQVEKANLLAKMHNKLEISHDAIMLVERGAYVTELRRIDDMRTACQNKYDYVRQDEKKSLEYQKKSIDMELFGKVDCLKEEVLKLKQYVRGYTPYELARNLVIEQVIANNKMAGIPTLEKFSSEAEKEEDIAVTLDTIDKKMMTALDRVVVWSVDDGIDDCEDSEASEVSEVSEASKVEEIDAKIVVKDLYDKAMLNYNRHSLMDAADSLRDIGELFLNANDDSIGYSDRFPNVAHYSDEYSVDWTKLTDEAFDTIRLAMLFSSDTGPKDWSYLLNAIMMKYDNLHTKYPNSIKIDWHREFMRSVVRHNAACGCSVGEHLMDSLVDGLITGAHIYCPERSIIIQKIRDSITAGRQVNPEQGCFYGGAVKTIDILNESTDSEDYKITIDATSVEDIKESEPCLEYSMNTHKSTRIKTCEAASSPVIDAFHDALEAQIHVSARENILYEAKNNPNLSVEAKLAVDLTLGALMSKCNSIEAQLCEKDELDDHENHSIATDSSDDSALSKVDAAITKHWGQYLDSIMNDSDDSSESDDSSKSDDLSESDDSSESDNSSISDDLTTDIESLD